MTEFLRSVRCKTGFPSGRARDSFLRDDLTGEFHWFYARPGLYTLLSLQTTALVRPLQGQHLNLNAISCHVTARALSLATSIISSEPTVVSLCTRGIWHLEVGIHVLFTLSNDKCTVKDHVTSWVTSQRTRWYHLRRMFENFYLAEQFKFISMISNSLWYKI